MTERKPVEVPFESWVDRQIREAAERGEFDNLPGAGRPLPGRDAPDDEDWWLRGYLRREGVPTEALLPAPPAAPRRVPAPRGTSESGCRHHTPRDGMLAPPRGAVR